MTIDLEDKPCAVYWKEMHKVEHYFDGKPFERVAAFAHPDQAKELADKLTREHPAYLVFAGTNVGPEYHLGNTVERHLT